VFPTFLVLPLRDVLLEHKFGKLLSTTEKLLSNLPKLWPRRTSLRGNTREEGTETIHKASRRRATSIPETIARARPMTFPSLLEKRTSLGLALLGGDFSQHLLRSTERRRVRGSHKDSRRRAIVVLRSQRASARGVRRGAYGMVLAERSPDMFPAHHGPRRFRRDGEWGTGRW
jgi:hypothetical protein